MPAPINITTTDLKPFNLSVAKTQAVFQTNSTTYDQAGIKYNQAGLTWGGSDRKQGGNPINIGVDKA